MKREMVILVASILLMSFVIAQVGPADGTGPEHDEMVAAGGQEGSPVAGEGIGVRIMAGNYIGEGGQQMQVQSMANNMQRLMVGGISADSGLNLTQMQVQNGTRLETRLSNGRNAEIKIMPDAASETALQQLRLNVCSEENNCSIELKEVALANEVRAAYEMSVQRQSKFLGMFQARMTVQAQVDAETGEVIRVNKPWWAFLATEPEEE